MKFGIKLFFIDTIVLVTCLEVLHFHKYTCMDTFIQLGVLPCWSKTTSFTWRAKRRHRIARSSKLELCSWRNKLLPQKLYCITCHAALRLQPRFTYKYPYIHVYFMNWSLLPYCSNTSHGRWPARWRQGQRAWVEWHRPSSMKLFITEIYQCTLKSKLFILKRNI